MKKALDQTIRDLKREVNKKVLKVPGVEQKVLDATSNEPWGPHGAHLADIAQATRNYHEYQMIMAILWKRINDTGKNWRHVYKALTVLEYLVAHGSERVIDDIREHAYQIKTLHDFQYIDSSGRDQGNNVRKKSQSLVVLVSDKERIQEVREKANVNRDKFRNTSSTGGMHRPGSYSSTGGYGDRPDDDRYGYKDDDRNGYGRENDDRYGRGGDSYGQDGDRYGRDSDERYGRDGYRDDDHRGRSRSTDEYQYGSRSRSSDRGYDDDGRYSSRSSGARADDPSQDEGRLERKFSEPNIAPPPYEEAVSNSRSPVHDERDRGTTEAPVAKASSPTGSTSQGPETHMAGTAASPPTNQEFGGFDEFDPRGPFSAAPAAPTTVNNGDVDLLGSLSNSFSSDGLAIMPMTTTTPEADLPVSSGPAQTFVALSSASTVLNQSAQDPFGDSPFKATQTSGNIPDHTHTSNFQPTAMSQSSQPFQPGAPKTETVPSFGFGDTFSGPTYTPDHVSNNNLQLALTEPSVSNQDIDVLADILPPSGSTAPQASQAGFSAPPGPFGQHQNNVHGDFLPQGGYTAPTASQGPFYTPVQPVQQNSNAYGNLHPQSGHTDPAAMQQQSNNAYGSLQPQSGHTAPVVVPPVQQNTNAYGNLQPQSGHTAPVAVPPVQQNTNAYGNLQPQSGYTSPVASYEAPPVTTSANTRPQKKFEPKSSVWSDTLSKGLVNFNISGPKTNPLADIGVDFDSLNRREKREKPASTNPVASTISMGKAMGSGSGIGRAGANSLAPSSNPGMGANMGMAGRPGMGMGMAGGPGMGVGMAGGPGMGMVGNPGMGMGMGMGMAGNGGMGMNMGGYGGMNQPMGMGMGMNNMGMGMNMAPGGQMRPPLPGQNIPGNYNTMMGPGGYPQQPYGGYR